MQIYIFSLCKYKMDKTLNSVKKGRRKKMKKKKTLPEKLHLLLKAHCICMCMCVYICVFVLRFFLAHTYTHACVKFECIYITRAVFYLG